MADQIPGSNYNEDAAKKALANAEKLIKTQKSLNSSAEQYKALWGSISSSMFNIGAAEWFKKVPKTTEDLQKELDVIKQIEKGMSGLGDIINDNLKITKETREAISKTLDPLNNLAFNPQLDVKGLDLTNEEINSLMGNLKKAELTVHDLAKNQDLYNQYLGESEVSWEKLQSKTEDFNKAETKYNAEYKKFIDKEIKGTLKTELQGINDIKDEYHKKLVLEAVANNKINEYLKKHGDLAAENLRTANLLNEEGIQATLQHQQLNAELKTAEAEYKNINKEVFSFSKGMESIVKQMAGKMVDALFAFDQSISDAHKNFGLVLKDSASVTAQMSLLTSEAAQFGMSIEDTTAMMGNMSAELHSTNFSVLKTAVQDFKAIEQSTGLAGENLGMMAGELMRAGKSSKDVKNFVEKTSQQAKALGVNQKKILADVAKNLGKWREMGFKGGEDSLARMALKAEKLGQNIDSIFDMAKKARNIEGAMEMAAELQLAAGSFANINPMDLLSAARKGPEELQKILGKMGADIGHFNEETKKFEFDAVDVDRLQMVSDATGVSLTDLQNQIQKQAENNKKLDLFPPDMFQGIKDATGALKDADIAKMAFADQLNIGKDGKIEIAPDTDLANWAKEQGITDYTQMGHEQIQAFTTYQEKNAKSLEQQAKQNASAKKSWEALQQTLINLVTVLEPLLQAFSWFVQKLTDFINFFPGAIKIPVVLLLAGLATFGTSFISGFGGIVKGFAGGLKNLATGGIKGMMGGGGAGSKMPDTSKLDPKGGGALQSLSAGIKSFGNVSPADLAKFAAAMAIIGIAIIGFGIALAKFGGEASLKQLATAGASLLMLGGAVFLLSKIQVDVASITKTALAMAIIGAALIPFALAAQMMQDVSWETLAKIGVSIVGFLTLMTIAGALLMGPQLLALGIGVAALIGVGIGLATFGASMLIASAGFNALASVDWSSFSAMGSALTAVVPGLLGFSMAALAFANPVTLFGLVMMTATLAGLAMVVSELSEGFGSGADGMDRFAMGLERIQAAAEKLDISKLESLKEVSEGFAAASAGDAIAGAISGVMNKLSGGDSKEKSVKKELVITLKQPNGREIQKVIINDTDLLS